MKVSSYTAASTIPAKLFCDKSLIDDILENKYIRPTHIQINPTNKCPLNCSFCSCKNRDRSLELSLVDILDMTNKFRQLGTKAVTITGGGDPLAYPHLKAYVNCLYDNNIKVGLVTNGILFDRLKDLSFIEKFTWCRISLSGEYDFSDIKFEDVIKKYKTDWSFSFVVNKNFSLCKLIRAIQIANENNFTHVRLVEDIIGENNNTMESIKDELRYAHIDDSKVIYQGRKQYTKKGHKRCLISLLKPNIGPDGNIYACCGVQFSKDPPALDLDANDSMGSNIEDVWKSQKYYDGSKCKKCYYSDYNNLLNIMLDANKLNHKEFI
jgi:MoaA/NifB/PqqE/SkfB family radical SAM enzyme